MAQALASLHPPSVQLRSLSRIAQHRDTRMLDAGCGAGELIFNLAELGFRSVHGVDPYIESDLSYGNGANVPRDSLYNIHGVWDVVMFHHLFEHLPDPVAALQHVRCILHDDGWCLLRVPTVSSFAWEHYGVNWVQLDAPRHLYLFSIESIERLARDCGFRVEAVEFDSAEFQFWGSEQYCRDIPLRSPGSYAEQADPSPFTPAQIRDFASRAKTLNRENRGDQAAFYLRCVR